MAQLYFWPLVCLLFWFSDGSLLVFGLLTFSGIYDGSTGTLLASTTAFVSLLIGVASIGDE